MYYVKAFTWTFFQDLLSEIFHDALINILSFCAPSIVFCYLLSISSCQNIISLRAGIYFLYFGACSTKDSAWHIGNTNPGWVFVKFIMHLHAPSKPLDSCVTNDETEAQKCNFPKATQLVSDRANSY